MSTILHKKKTFRATGSIEKALTLVWLIALMLCGSLAQAQEASRLSEAGKASHVYHPHDLTVAKPQFPGGERAMNNYLIRHIRYPRQAVKNKTQGIVKVLAMIECDGSVSACYVENDIGDGCSEALVKAVKGMPKWKHASLRGRPVRYEMPIEIAFILP